MEMNSFSSLLDSLKFSDSCHDFLAVEVHADTDELHFSSLQVYEDPH